MRALLRHASPIAMAILMAVASTPVAPERGAGLSCIAASPIELIRARDPNTVIFVGTVLQAGAGWSMEVDAELSGPLPPRVELTLEEWMPDPAVDPPAVGSVFIVAAARGADGRLVAGPCALPQPITTREEGEQIVALASAAVAQGSFDNLPPASMVSLGIGMEERNPIPTASPAGSVSAVTTPPPASPVPVIAVMTGILLGIAGVGLAAFGRHRSVVTVALAAAAATLVLAGAAASIALTPARTASRQEPPTATSPAPAAPRLQLPTRRDGLRDASRLAEVLEESGFACGTSSSAGDNVASWTCGAPAAEGIDLLLSFSSNLRDPTIIGYGIEFSTTDGRPLVGPLDPADHAALTDLVVGDADREKLRDWLTRTWAIHSIVDQVGPIHVWRDGSALSLDLRFGE